MKPTTEDRKNTIVDEMEKLNGEFNKLTEQNRTINRVISNNRVRFEQLRGQLQMVEDMLGEEKEAKKAEKKSSKKE
jgi:hypothetical protein